MMCASTVIGPRSCYRCEKHVGCPALTHGARVEREHSSLYRHIAKHGLPREEDFYRAIAAAHLKERPDYYTRLEQFVEA